MALINNQLQTRTIPKCLNNFHLFPSLFKSKSLGKFTYFRFRRKTTYVRICLNEHWIVENESILSDSFWVWMMFRDSFSIRLHSNVLWDIPFSTHIICIFEWLCRIIAKNWLFFNNSWLYRIIHNYWINIIPIIQSFTIKSANNNRNCRMNNRHRQYSMVCYTNFQWYIIENNSFMPWK